MATVLIIDDDSAVRDLLTDVLLQDGHFVRTAKSGTLGVEIAKGEAIDLVVTDIMMPDKDGIETLLEIKAHKPNLKVMAVSGGGTIKDGSFLGVAQELGADAVLEKPVDIYEFSDKVALMAR